MVISLISFKQTWRFLSSRSMWINFFNISWASKKGVIYCLGLRTSEIHLFYNLQLFYWHFLEILWLFIFLVFYKLLPDFKGNLQFIILSSLSSFILAVAFISLQIKEFRIMGLSINDSVYSSLFFFLTGLHFFHLLVGLFLCCLLFWSCSFSSFLASPKGKTWDGKKEKKSQEKFLSYGRILTLHYYFLLMCILLSLFYDGFIFSFFTSIIEEHCWFHLGNRFFLPSLHAISRLSFLYLGCRTSKNAFLSNAAAREE